MKPQVRTISVQNDLMLNFELLADTLILNAIEVNSEYDSVADLNAQIATLEKMEIDPQLMLQTPSTNGLPDVTKYIQNIAGVQTAS